MRALYFCHLVHIYDKVPTFIQHSETAGAVTEGTSLLDLLSTLSQLALAARTHLH